MSMKSAALLAWVGMLILTVLAGAIFLRDVMNLGRGVIAPVSVFVSLIELFAALGVTVFLFVFYRNSA